MLYSYYINKLRKQCGDIKKRIHIDWTGNGTTTVFQMPADTYPVLDDVSTYTVRVNSVIQTEITNYTLDKDSGTLTMVGAPADTTAVSIDSINVKLKDADWLEIINDVIISLGLDFFKEFVDETNFSSTAGMTSLSLVALRSKCIAVYQFQQRLSSVDNWQQVESFANWRYDRENNIIYLGRNDAFTLTNIRLRIRGLEGYTLGDAVTDTIDVQDRYMTIIEFGALARYYRYRYKDVIELISKMTQETTRTPLQELVMLSDRFDRLYESEKAKLKPMKPSYNIPVFLQGGGRP